MLVLFLGMKSLERSPNRRFSEPRGHPPSHPYDSPLEQSGSKVTIDCCGLPVGLQVYFGIFMGSPNLTTYTPEVSQFAPEN